MDKVYIGRYSQDKGIEICSFEDGCMAVEAELPVIADPSYLHKHGNVLYAVSETADYNGQNGGAVAAIDLITRTVTNIQATLGKHPCHVTSSLDGTWLYVSNYTEGSLSVFKSIDKGIGTIHSHIVHSGHGLNPDRQEQPHVHFSGLYGEGRYLLAVDLGADCVVGYAISPEGLSDKQFNVALPDGAGPRHFVLSEREDFLYVICELSNEIAVFKRRGETSFKLLQSVSTLPPDFNGASTAAAIRISSDGRFVYASNRGHDSVAVFGVSDSPAYGGKLTRLQLIDCGGQCPRDIALADGEAYLLVANEGSDSITALKRDAKTGLLSEATTVLETQRPTCLLAERKEIV